MPRNFDERLARLRTRRMDDQNTVLASRGFGESYEKRSANKATKYVLGAMQEVDPRSTQISHEEARRLRGTLRKDWKLKGFFRTFDYRDRFRSMSTFAVLAMLICSSLRVATCATKAAKGAARATFPILVGANWWTMFCSSDRNPKRF